MLATRRQLLRAALGAASAGALSMLPACASRSDAVLGPEEPQSLQSSFFCFDTACVIGGVMDQDVLDAVVERCQGFEQTLSRTLPSSDVGRINAAGGVPVEVASETADLVSRALDYCKASDGLFDITIGAVSSLWDFKQGVVPTDEQIAEALPHVGYGCVQVSGQRVTLTDPQAKLDLGGIAKGYVADVLVAQLEDAGVTSGYVNLGGNVKVLGTKPDGTAWRVGVRDPHPEARESDSIARVTLEGGSVVTSGLYERRFEKDGKSYWHILDPRTGYPAQSDLVSATVVSEQSIDGDGYTKPLFMMGRERALSWAAGQEGLRVLLVGVDDAIDMFPQGSFELLG